VWALKVMLNAIQRTKLRQTALVTPLEKETKSKKWGEMAVVEYSPQIIEPRPHFVQSWLPWLRWVPSSAQLLQKSEEDLLGHLENPGEGFYVKAGTVGGHEVRVWTKRWQGPTPSLSKPPLVMVHGMGAGLAMFALNIPELSKERTVLAIDLPGFGRSSRPPFSSKEEKIVEEYTQVLESWREGMELEKIHLLGHSFGGYLTAHYKLRHPDRVEKFILADPWGMMPRPEDVFEKYEVGWGFKMAFSILKQFNPLGVMRLSGPWGPGLATSRRPDLARKFIPLLGEEDSVQVNNYLYHCNAHRAEGESAFRRLSRDFFWAKSPFLAEQKEKLDNWTMLLGDRSWIAMGQHSEFTTECARLGISLNWIPDAGHHIYADQAAIFNKAVKKALS